jgi:hypothetical protein
MLGLAIAFARYVLDRVFRPRSAPINTRLRLAVVATTATLAATASVRADTLARLHPAPVDVDVVLVLAADVSQSMDDGEQKIQRAGYVEALTSKEVMQAIRMGTHGRIAVTYVEWGSEDAQLVIAPWMVVDGEDTAKAFAAQIAEAPIRNLYRTSISRALEFAVNLIETSGFEPIRKVIDISGDGPNNQGPTLAVAREAAIAKGITINGLPLIIGDSTIGWQQNVTLDRYYEDCVIGGTGAFFVPVEGMQNFAKALKLKLVLEIAGLMTEPTVQPAAGWTPVDCKAYE